MQIQIHTLTHTHTHSHLMFNCWSAYLNDFIINHIDVENGQPHAMLAVIMNYWILSKFDSSPVDHEFHFQLSHGIASVFVPILRCMNFFLGLIVNYELKLVFIPKKSGN